MGEPSFYCDPSSEGCCLNFPETIVVLVALIIVVQLALKLAVVICYYLWYLVGVMFGMLVVPVRVKPKLTTSKTKKIFAVKSKASLHWSEEDVPRRRRRKESRSPSRRKESRSPSRHCLHCTLDPLKVTMNLQKDPYRAGRRLYADYPPPRYYKYDSESRPRPRRASAPSAYAVTRFREASVGSSDPILRASGSNTPERRSMAAGTEIIPRQRAGEADAEHPRRSRSRRPAKVYIYPVNPQTPPGSRSSSPGRSSRRRRRRAITSSQEDRREARSARRKAREAGQQTSPTMTLQYQPGSTNVSQRHGQTEPPTGKSRYYWSDQVSNADWVYRPVK